MIDWNGNGKIDPVDTGISMAAFHESEQSKRASKSGCLTACFLIASLIFHIVLLIGG